MNKDLQYEFYKLFDSGITDLNLAPNKLELCGYYFQSLSLSEQEECLNEALVRQRAECTFNAISKTMIHPVSANVEDLGVCILSKLRAYILEYLPDHFNDAYDIYKREKSLQENDWPRDRGCDDDISFYQYG